MFEFINNELDFLPPKGCKGFNIVDNIYGVPGYWASFVENGLPIICYYHIDGTNFGLYHNGNLVERKWQPKEGEAFYYVHGDAPNWFARARIYNEDRYRGKSLEQNCFKTELEADAKIIALVNVWNSI